MESVTPLILEELLLGKIFKTLIKFFFSKWSNFNFILHFFYFFFRFTFGACVLKNFKKQRWERYFLILSLIFFTIYVIFAIFWNIFYKVSVTDIDAIYEAMAQLEEQMGSFKKDAAQFLDDLNDDWKSYFETKLPPNKKHFQTLV